MNNNILKYALIIGGFIASSALGAVIYGMFFAPNVLNGDNDQLPNEFLDRQPSDNSIDSEGNTGKMNYFGYEQPASVSSEEKAVVFNTPKADALQEERGIYMEHLRRLAVSTTQAVVIGQDCEPSPFVLHSIDRNVGFINKSSELVTLYFYEPKSIEISLESEEGTEIAFFEGEGVFGYSCGERDNPAGIVLISG